MSETPDYSGNPDHSALHSVVERTEEQGIWVMQTKSVKPMIVEHRADGCVTWREPETEAQA